MNPSPGGGLRGLPWGRKRDGRKPRRRKSNVLLPSVPKTESDSLTTFELLRGDGARAWHRRSVGFWLGPSPGSRPGRGRVVAEGGFGWLSGRRPTRSRVGKPRRSASLAALSRSVLAEVKLTAFRCSAQSRRPGTKSLEQALPPCELRDVRVSAVVLTTVQQACTECAKLAKSG